MNRHVGDRFQRKLAVKGQERRYRDYRVPAALSIAGAFSLLTVGCGLYVSGQLRQSSALFVTSAAELRLDGQALDPKRMPT